MMTTPPQDESTTSERDSFRQVALLLEAMPARTHRVILGQLDHDEILEVERLRAEVGDADAVEQLRVLKQLQHQLQRETQNAESVESEIQDEIQIGRARVSRKRSAPGYRSGDSPVTQSIGDHPAASAPNPHSDADSGSIFSDARRATERPSGPSRIGHPSLTHDAVSHASRPIARDNGNHRQNEQPSPTTDFRSSADPVQSREFMQQMFAQFQQTQAAGVLPKGGADWTPSGHPSQLHAGEAPERPHLIPFPGNGMPSDSTPPSPGHWEAEELAARVDRFLVELPPKVLCRALGMVSTRQAFLVLCGLPNDTAETVLKMLPRRQARKVRNDMRKMGQLQLADIDAAKQVVTQLALEEGSQPNSVAA